MGQGGVSSFAYGADEFIYVLGKCLINYGSVIGAGIYQATTAGASQQNIKHGRKETNYLTAKARNDVSMEHNIPMRSVREGNPVTMQSESIPGPQSASQSNPQTQHSPKRAKIDWSKWTPGPSSQPKEKSESEKQEFQLREQIKSLKVDFEEDESILDMADVAGLQSVKIALDEFACFFLHFPHLTRNLRHRSTTGILLFGPQGTGKTLLIKSFAKKYNLAVYDTRASAIMSKFVGESEKFVRALFQEVRANTPSVLLLDECDGLLCNPSADATQSHNYRLLQNELKNQWSDLMYSRDEVIIIGVTNKPQDIDMDGFGRRLSLKLHVALPNESGCQQILKGALDRLRHQLSDEDFTMLGSLCHDRAFSGYDVDCLVEGVLRRALRGIAVAKWFKRVDWDDGSIVVPCEGDEAGAMEGPYVKLVDNVEDVSYRPFTVADVKDAIHRARATVDEAMMQKHILFASQYATED